MRPYIGDHDEGGLSSRSVLTNTSRDSVMTSMAKELNRTFLNPVQDAFAFLNTTYEHTIGLFLLYDRLTAVPQKQVIAKEICIALHINIQMEEQVFYPAVKQVLIKQGVLSAAIMRNSITKYLLAEAEALDVDSDIFELKIKVLGEQVKEHIKETRARLFPQIKSCGKLNLWDLGAQLDSYKNDMLSKMAS